MLSSCNTWQCPVWPNKSLQPTPLRGAAELNRSSDLARPRGEFEESEVGPAVPAAR